MKVIKKAKKQEQTLHRTKAVRKEVKERRLTRLKRAPTKMEGKLRLKKAKQLGI